MADAVPHRRDWRDLSFVHRDQRLSGANDRGYDPASVGTTITPTGYKNASQLAGILTLNPQVGDFVGASVGTYGWNFNSGVYQAPNAPAHIVACPNNTCDGTMGAFTLSKPWTVNVTSPGTTFTVILPATVQNVSYDHNVYVVNAKGPDSPDGAGASTNSPSILALAGYANTLSATITDNYYDSCGTSSLASGRDPCVAPPLNGLLGAGNNYGREAHMGVFGSRGQVHRHIKNSGCCFGIQGLSPIS